MIYMQEPCACSELEVSKAKDFDKEQKAQFEALVKPLMKFLCENLHPHVVVIVEPTSAEILEGACAFQTEEFLKD